MRRGVLFSSFLHVAILGLAYLHLWDLIFPPRPLEDTPIAVQLVNLAPVTRATRLNQTPPKPEAKPETPNHNRASYSGVPIAPASAADRTDELR